MMFWGDGMGWWLFGGISMVVFWGAVIFLVVWVVRKLAQPADGRKDNRSALDIARERYARGEISREEFEQLKKDLS
ncbi:MAG: SHOCT domain-containing protein [Chloroflexota bacterium]